MSDKKSPLEIARELYQNLISGRFAAPDVALSLIDRVLREAGEAGNYAALVDDGRDSDSVLTEIKARVQELLANRETGGRRR